MNGWAVQDVSNGTVSLSGVVANSPIDIQGWRVTAGGATKGIVVKITVASITQVGTITATLQTAIGSDWVTAKASASITAAGPVYIRLMDTVSADAAVMPLLGKGRIVVTTTNAGDAISISKVEVLQAL